MTVFAKTVAEPFASTRSADTSATATSQLAETGAGTLFLIDIDNTNNSTKTYVKMYDATAPTIGTTNPDWIFMAPASVRRVYSIPGGLAFSTGLSYAAVTTAGSPGTTSPTSSVAVRLSFD